MTEEAAWAEGPRQVLERLCEAPDLGPPPIPPQPAQNRANVRLFSHLCTGAAKGSGSQGCWGSTGAHSVKLLRQVVRHTVGAQSILARMFFNHQTGNRHLAQGVEGLPDALVYTLGAARLGEADRGRSCSCKINIGPVDGSQQGPDPEASWEGGKLWTRATVGSGKWEWRCRGGGIQAQRRGVLI